MDPQPLATNIWDVYVIDKFNLCSLAMFDGKSNP